MSYEELDELMEQAAEMEHGPTQVAVLEEAVREADALADDEVSFEVRMDFIEAATFSGHPEKALVAFSWCLSKYDEDPELVDEFDLLWKYKWVVNSLTNFPQISKRQITSMQDDMEARYLKADFNLRPVNYLRWINSLHMGDLEQARHFFEKWKQLPRDSMADCEACEQDHHIDLMIRLGHDEEAVRLAQPILDEEMSCAEIPQGTLGAILRPLMRLNRLDEALKWHKQGYSLVCKNPEFLSEVASHLEFLVHARSLKQGFRLFERHLPWAAATADAENRFSFYLSCSLLLRALQAQAPGKRIRLRIPHSLACHRDDDSYVIADLAAWFDQQTEELAGRFNQRNGNEFHTARIREAYELVGVER